MNCIFRICICFGLTHEQKIISLDKYPILNIYNDQSGILEIHTNNVNKAAKFNNFRVRAQLFCPQRLSLGQHNAHLTISSLAHSLECYAMFCVVLFFVLCEPHSLVAYGQTRVIQSNKAQDGALWLTVCRARKPSYTHIQTHSTTKRAPMKNRIKSIARKQTHQQQKQQQKNTGICSAQRCPV